MSDIDLTELYEQAKAHSLFCSSPHHFVLTVEALREIILADREKQAQVEAAIAKATGGAA